MCYNHAYPYKGDDKLAKAAITFGVKSWEEKAYDEFGEGQKLTRSNVTYSYSGDLEGEGKVEYLMVYNPDGSGVVIALERVSGKLAGRSGSFVVQHNGTFHAHGVNNRWSVVPGSGTDGFKGLTGFSDCEISGAGPYPITFEYDLG
jgi:hypothetical protein